MADGKLAIKVEHVSKTFKLPHEKTNSIKGAVINFYKRNKSYEKQRALQDVSFEIKQGEFFGIVGRNGSGKSTLLKLLAGIYTPSKGSITVNGKLTPFIELGVGFNQELSGRENVYLNGALLGFNRKEMAAMYDDIVKFAELKRFMDQKLKNYSSGMQVRLAFSIAIRAKGDILLLDEVLAVGDAAFQQKCYDYFEQLKLQHRTVVFVTHDMGAVQRFCTRALRIENGVVQEIGDPAEIADAYTEDNIDSSAADNSGKSTIRVTIVDHNEAAQTVRFRIEYEPQTVKAYVGFSIIKAGATFAEMNNLKKLDKVANNAIDYTVATDNLNPGIYEISAALFNVDTKALLGITRQKAKFIIKGYDKTRGGALTLPDKWTTP